MGATPDSWLPVSQRPGGAGQAQLLELLTSALVPCPLPCSWIPRQGHRCSVLVLASIPGLRALGCCSKLEVPASWPPPRKPFCEGQVSARESTVSLPGAPTQGNSGGVGGHPLTSPFQCSTVTQPSRLCSHPSEGGDSLCCGQLARYFQVHREGGMRQYLPVPGPWGCPSYSCPPCSQLLGSPC